MVTLRELSAIEDGFVAGHGLCPGCAIPVILRILLRATNDPVIVSNATGCLEVCSSMFPLNSWRIPWIHSAFENTAATAAGLESMYRALVRRGKISGNKNIKFLAIGGDGGTYDIGFQALSGAMERGHKILYVCYDNQIYANTGGQRSSATPLGASATTSPAGTASYGKVQWRKDLTKIIAAHNVAYAAQGAPSRWQDLYNKAKKAFEADGPSFLNVLTACPTEWKTDPDQSIRLTQLAVDTCFWPLWEYDNGKYRITYFPKDKKPVSEWLKVQGRFKHLFLEENRYVLEEIQKRVDEEWERLNKLVSP
ncbi:MAG: thiamine pyrophosphate-dependent enzyme [Acidobacteriota bacterium]